MIKMYSPNQISLGTYLGGPFAAIYFLKRNFDALNKEDLSKKTMQIGILFSIIILATMPFIPENTPNLLIPMLYLIPVIIVVGKHQMKKEEIIESSEHDFQSNWKVFGMSIVWLLAFLVVGVILLMVLESAGVISLA